MPDTDIPKESFSAFGGPVSADDLPLDDEVPASDVAEPSQEVREFRIGLRETPERLDKVLARLIPEHSRARLQEWITQGHVTVNGQAAAVRRMVMPGDSIRVQAQPLPQALAFRPELVSFQVLDASAQWIVVEKPAGLVTHPGAGNWSGTLLNGLLHRFPELANVPRAGIVHRLDKDTSGLLVVARTPTAQTDLVRQLQARSVSREYLALAHGHLIEAGRVDTPIGRDPRVPVRMTAQRPVAPKPAITHYAPERVGRAPEGGVVTQVCCRLETGRTHQIRVHLGYLGHPLLGDALYGGQGLAGVQRQMLHARALAFLDPASGDEVSFRSALPPDFLLAQEAIQWEGAHGGGQG